MISSKELTVWYRCEDDQIVRFEEVSGKQEISVERCWPEEGRSFLNVRFKQFEFELPGSMDTFSALALVDKIAEKLGYILTKKS